MTSKKMLEPVGHLSSNLKKKKFPGPTGFQGVRVSSRAASSWQTPGVCAEALDSAVGCSGQAPTPSLGDLPTGVLSRQQQALLSHSLAKPDLQYLEPFKPAGVYPTNSETSQANLRCSP